MSIKNKYKIELMLRSNFIKSYKFLKIKINLQFSKNYI